MTCPICAKPCRPRLVTCGRRACVLRQISRRMRGNGQQQQAAAATQKAYNQRMQAVIGFHFGTLSERERQLFACVWKFAWQRGYMKARRRHAREAA